MRLRPLLAEVTSWWLVTLGLWCAFIGSISSSELIAGAAAGLICGLVVGQLRAHDWSGFRVSLRWLAWPPLIVATATVETVLLARSLWRWSVRGDHEQAEFRTIPLAPAGTSSRARARHALATTAISASPGSIVLQTYPDLGEARAHLLLSGGPDLISRIGGSKR